MVSDSRRVGPGALFVCMPSVSRDTHNLLDEVAAQGAVAAIVHSRSGMEKAQRLGLSGCLVPTQELSGSGTEEAQIQDAWGDFLQMLWRVSAAFYDHPSRAMKVIGITGTNGKTSVAWMIRDCLNALGVKCAYVGTLGIIDPQGEWTTLPNTTPMSIELQHILAGLRDSGTQAVALEVSSHALSQWRIDGTELDVAVWTNLTQDHFDYHGYAQAYRAAKRRIFDLPSSKPLVRVMNGEDPALQSEVSNANRTFVYGREQCTLSAKIGFTEIELTLQSGTPLMAAIGGSYNLSNLLAVISVLKALGYDEEAIVRCALAIRPVPGRMEGIRRGSVIAIVDYAHTPDALQKVLESIRDLHPGDIWTVFGCGGDRDPSKRPLMAEVAERLSDRVIITSDNPRTEDPMKILEDIQQGLKEKEAAVVESDRAAAIAYALGNCPDGSVVLIAGKGHENYQIVGKSKSHFDDREHAEAALKERFP